jgi:hypothetical protein
MPPIAIGRWWSALPDITSGMQTSAEVMKRSILMKLKAFPAALDRQMERIRFYQSLAFYTEVHRLPYAARRRLGLKE